MPPDNEERRPKEEAAPRTPTKESAASVSRLTPRRGDLYVVRWLRSGPRGDVAHRYFRRRHDVEEFFFRLRNYDKRVAIFRTRVTDWAPTWWTS